jgi:adenylate cyclase class 2
MKSEIEVKFLNVGFDQVRAKLRELGAECEQPMWLMKRVTIETPELLEKKSYVRVRDEGDKVTLTYKQFDSLSVDGAKEIEITVSDFKGAVALLAAAGLPHISFQESKRETWKIGSVEVVLDEWPWLNPYIEIEGDSEAELKDMAKQLGFNWDDAVFGGVTIAYRAQYPHIDPGDTVGRIAEIKFGDPVPEFLQPKV